MRIRTLVVLAVFAPATLAAQVRRPMTFDDFAAMKAVSDPQISPDGRTMLFAVRTTDVDANRRATTTYGRR
jgi:acylaminoacyl-peptidase